MTNFEVVAVLGAGTMGSGIAHVLARQGIQVLLCEVDREALDRGLKIIRSNLGRQAAKDPDLNVEETMRRIRGVVHREELAECGFAIEAATERLEIKRQIFRDLDRTLGPEAILASNTSSISITGLASQTGRPGKVIGMHFFNPVPVMRLVEIVRGLATEPETYEKTHALALRLGKTPVLANDAPGFVSNRVLMPLLNEAMYAVMEGVATAEAVDQVFRLGMAHPLGPLALADLIGLDVCLDIMRVLEEGFGGQKFHPCPLLVRMVDAGWLGRKAGRGFYRYPG